MISSEEILKDFLVSMLKVLLVRMNFLDLCFHSRWDFIHLDVETAVCVFFFCVILPGFKFQFFGLAS